MAEPVAAGYNPETVQGPETLRALPAPAAGAASFLPGNTRIQTCEPVPVAGIPLVFRNFCDLQHYEPVWRAMQAFTSARTCASADEVWTLEHHPVFTQGQTGKPAHLLNTGTVPVVHTDRGGQVTYHGPGQLVVYLMIDLRRRGFGVRALVTLIEQAIIAVLAGYGIQTGTRSGAPGVYTCAGDKIASLGLRVRRSCTFHGLAFNIRTDLTLFHGINPCGYAGLKMVNLTDFCPGVSLDAVRANLVKTLKTKLMTCVPEQARKPQTKPA